MSRQVEFHENELVLHLSGLLSLAALKRQIIIPYRSITKVHVGSFDAPFWMLKMPGTALPGFDIYEGSFRYNGEWYFLSYEHRGPLIIIELDKHEHYHYVIFEVQNPEQIVAEILKYCPHNKE
ncbi:hypothetical protein O9H85_32615 [Paenibacillus filicis]|uniref:Bacterial Pleckstrin homology domain-containing protein n=1 Tax=Paenibacillus gyeongsangnamensis TaxID=3388067 RepID=A0ABT4QJG0_9BACL|nr:hypothetical protein [Paenibacillus filicis]MCZ8517017.1 hypothetical protein [Paenibacillus filicis]